MWLVHNTLLLRFCSAEALGPLLGLTIVRPILLEELALQDPALLDDLGTVEAPSQAFLRFEVTQDDVWQNKTMWHAMVLASLASLALLVVLAILRHKAFLHFKGFFIFNVVILSLALQLVQAIMASVGLESRQYYAASVVMRAQDPIRL